MSKPNEPEAVAVPAIDPQAAQIIGQAIAAGIQASQPRRALKLHERRKQDPWQPPAGQKKLALLPGWECFQNNTRLDPHKMSNAEIDLVNRTAQLVKQIGAVTCQSLAGLVVVFHRQRGTANEFHVQYATKSIEQRNAISKVARDFEELMSKALRDAEAEAEEREKFGRALATAR